jgi:hypothetical protein
LNRRFLKNPPLSGFGLKAAAVVSMTIDHIGAVLFPHALWFRMAGRPAFILFAFLITEGFSHTRSRRNYAVRLGIFALLSEIPFDLAHSGGIDFGFQNVFFTLLIGLGVCAGLEWAGPRLALSLPVLFGGLLAAELLRSDYGAWGIMLIALFYYSKSDVARSLTVVLFCAALFQAWGTGSAISPFWGLFALPFIWAYNGRRGGGRWETFGKYFVYAY